MNLHAKRNRNTSCNQRLEMAVESLESREMMAGDVTVRVNGNAVTVIGSNEADQIQITSSFGEVTVQATGDLGTTVNGQESFSTGLVSLERLTIRLRGGDDRISFRNTVVDGVTRISLGGSDTGGEIALNNGVELETLIIRGSSKSDIVTIGQPEIGEMKFNMGGGNDFVSISAIAQLGDSHSIRMGSGEDHVRVNSLPGSVSRLRLFGNGGNDLLSAVGEAFESASLEHRGFEEFITINA